MSRLVYLGYCYPFIIINIEGKRKFVHMGNIRSQETLGVYTVSLELSPEKRLKNCR